MVSYEHELKNAYIGWDVQPLEYSVDYRGNSTTNLQNDGWVLKYGNRACDSNGIYTTSADPRGRSYKYFWFDLSNAKKITFEVNWKKNNTNAWFRTGLMAPTDWDNDRWGFGSIYTQWTLCQLDLNYSQFYRNNNLSDATGTYTQVMEFDFANKTRTLSQYRTGSWSLTDEQIATLRTATGIFFWLLQWQNQRTYTLKVHIEY